jgi:hypothetical protein
MIISKSIHRQKSNRLKKFGFEKFYKLADNSMKVKNYSLTIDNCRLAVNIALDENNLMLAAKAYKLWINALFIKHAYNDVVKICRSTRTKYGNSIGLLYFECKATYGLKDYKSVAKLGDKILNMYKSKKSIQNDLFKITQEQILEIENLLSNVKNRFNKNK